MQDIRHILYREHHAAQQHDRKHQGDTADQHSRLLGIGAQSVGLCEAAYREALKYAQEREQFGKPIIRFAAVAEMLSNMKAKLQGVRALLYETTRFVEVYKQYGHIAHERPLEGDERQEMKFYNRLHAAR